MLIINRLWRFVISRHSLAATFLRKLKAKELTTNDSAGSVSVSELNQCLENLRKNNSAFSARSAREK